MGPLSVEPWKAIKRGRFCFPWTLSGTKNKTERCEWPSVLGLNFSQEPVSRTEDMTEDCTGISISNNPPGAADVGVLIMDDRSNKDCIVQSERALLVGESEWNGAPKEVQLRA